MTDEELRKMADPTALVSLPAATQLRAMAAELLDHRRERAGIAIKFTEAEKLASLAIIDSNAMTPAPWYPGGGADDCRVWTGPVDEHGYPDRVNSTPNEIGDCSLSPNPKENGRGIARTRNNLQALGQALLAMSVENRRLQEQLRDLLRQGTE